MSQSELIVKAFEAISGTYYLGGNYVFDLDQFDMDGLETFKGYITNYGNGIDYQAQPDNRHNPTDRIESPFGVIKFYKVMVYKLKYQFGGQEFSFSQIQMPQLKYRSAEFEELFGFGPSCEEYRTDKKIVVCPRHISVKYDDLQKILETQVADKEMLKFLLWLSVHGGYVNKSSGVSKLNVQLSELIQCDRLSQDEINKLVYLK